MFSENDGLPHPSVPAITQTRDGAVWVATGFSRHGGAARSFAGTITNLTKHDKLSGKSTRSVYQDTRGRMWIGYEYDGITVQVNGTEKILTEKEGLAGNEVKVMLQDRDGNYWFGTEKGLRHVNGTVPDAKFSLTQKPSLKF